MTTFATSAREIRGCSYSEIAAPALRRSRPNSMPMSSSSVTGGHLVQLLRFRAASGCSALLQRSVTDDSA